MMMNLFSIFDPSTSFFYMNNWMSLNIVYMSFPYLYWSFPSRTQMYLLMNFNFIKKELMNNLYKKNYKMLILLLSLFMIIIFNNVMGLCPYIFTATSHLLMTLSLALPFWILFMMYGWFMLTNHMLSHLLPLNTPMLLAMFMVMIETISNIIRPITLSVRLTANMIAGHLLMSLLSNISEKFPLYFFTSFMVLILLLILESAVAIIQSYVFTMLITLYLNEIN